MQLLVKSLITGKFLTSNGDWTTDPTLGRDFKTTTEALVFCQIHAIENVELVLGVTQQTVGLPLYSVHAQHGLPLDD